MVYQERKKNEIARAMDIPAEKLDVDYCFWAAIRDTFDRRDLVGTRKLIEKLCKLSMAIVPI